MGTVDLIPAIAERWYREIAKPQPRPKPAQAKEEAKQTLTRADVDAILARQRNASPEDLQYILDHNKEYRLSEWQRNQISVDVTVAMAARARGVNARKEDPNLEFITRTLGLIPTPFGLIERNFIDRILREGSRNIQRCPRHTPPNCSCWSAQRTALWDAGTHGDRTPEGWAASKMFEILESLELASRAEHDGHQDGDSYQRAIQTQNASGVEANPRGWKRNNSAQADE